MEEEKQIPSILNNQVSITNIATRAAQGFSLREKRLVMAGLSKLDSRKPLKTLADRTFRVTAMDYVELSQIADKKSAYKDLMAACEKLLDRHLKYEVTTPRGVKEKIINWVSSITYHHGEGWVEFSITEEIMPHVCELTRQFTKYRLRQASELRSLYSWRLLEVLTSYNNGKDETKVTKKKLSITELRIALEIPDSYKYNDIKNRILLKAVDELKAKDHWLIQWIPIKNGRSIVAIEFIFNRDPQTDVFKSNEL